MPNFNSRHVLFDTNVLLDAISDVRPEHTQALAALHHCNGGGDLGLATPSSLKDVYYVLRKDVPHAEALKGITRLLDLLVILPLDAEVALIAAGSNEPDFEDALVRSAAELNNVDFILTRDKKAFCSSKIRSMTCAEYLDIIAEEDRRLYASLAEGAQA